VCCFSARDDDESDWSKGFHFLREKKSAMPDVEIICSDCNEAFPFTEREQEYFTERNLSQPKRCKPCRDARKQNFGGSRGGDRPRFEIVCDQCGKTDSVPFKPSSGRPVLCGECFNASRAQ
jgi:CxxC-x17-CxxC domain-containing protein